MDGGAVLWALGRRWWGQRTGLWAAPLLAASPFAVQYAQELRPYALYLLVTLVGFWSQCGSMGVWEKSPTRPYSFLFGSKGLQQARQ